MKIIKSAYLFFASTLVCLFFAFPASAQQKYELNSDWFCANINEVKVGGAELSKPDFPVNQWMKATVPGTILTTLLDNKKVPDPFYGMNNELIKDIYHTGNAYYTYWFVKSFNQVAKGDEQIWLQFRGVNYKTEIYLNGKKVNAQVHEGMHLRQQYNITSLLAANGNNRLAVLVYPPDFPGNPNGGQGGDGTIAKGLTTQYTAGWDWIQPIRDRNTGIWDKVTIEKTKVVNLQNPHIVTLVPGKRSVDGLQQPAIIKASAELINTSFKPVTGTLLMTMAGKTSQIKVVLPANKNTEIQLPQLLLQNPKLWWPNGYGEQNLYPVKLQFITSTVSDEENLNVGVRQIETTFNTHTQSMETTINGQKIFIKGGNWIISDAMLRFSPERYDAEIRFHRDMNLNLIRIWGGAITERPEFYEACDKYGLLVFQDFWFSGDANGRWYDPLKKEDQWIRRKYPDNHQLVLTAAADQIKMIRNHASLAFWCGGNEITPPDDILLPLRDEILPKLDGTRTFIDFSNSDAMSVNTFGGNGDGPYGIQNPRTFWTNRTFPFNSEIGSVGVGDYESLKRFIPAANLIAPQYQGKVDSVWQYHKYIGYDQYIKPYGDVKNVQDFAQKAQLVNYNQYRALMEGFSAHMWDWYTGSIIWKTQNPWTALRGQMYDYYLDVNAALYGLKSGSEPLHIMLNPADSMITVVNNHFVSKRNLMVKAVAYDMAGKAHFLDQIFYEINPTTVKKCFSIKGAIEKLKQKDGLFIQLSLLDEKEQVLSENFYWLEDEDGTYRGLQRMDKTTLSIQPKVISKNKLEVKLTAPSNQPVAFFTRIALIDRQTNKRILPTFYSDNYVSIMPGTSKILSIDCNNVDLNNCEIEVYGWNVDRVSKAIF
ncbi:glycoside hydrolase family 2 protein [Pedobacter boryungensis]|uniref:Glycosyl hydrolase n=1 Tax=Pedobacter boryungensis TaxID=869962 RepID=A0ABX2DJM2_9SPHI|nr:glycoside hydrolase family 2 TIM barrel-domain containing protein [Pedobacter boryungensis]NQX33131.1 glycosyl hydrolase [Pedobacter boryungensis]